MSSIEEITLRRRIVMYCISGVVAAGVNFATFNTLDYLFAATVPGRIVTTIVANVLAFITGGFVSMRLHDRFSFGDRDELSHGMFWIGQVLAIGLVTGLSSWLVYEGFPKLAISGLTIGAGGSFTLTWNCVFTWKKQRSHTP